MARVTYEMGLKCKQCGNLSTHFNRYIRTVLCQNCGAHIMTYYGNREGKVTKNADIVSVKITHKLFKDILEEA